ncbi:MAG: dienelactone hydrolase family protein [Haloarculaceae archaeon]
MSETLRVPGPRDVHATLANSDATAAVVACPPHPQMGGDRHDSRLRAVDDALGDHSIACLRFDYGPWDQGRAEVTDARSALAWTRENFETVGLFGYSFGGAVALRAAADESDDGTPPAAVSLLAPASTLAGESTADAVDAIACPVQVLYGERDDTVDSVPVAERARARGHTVETLPADHFFAGQQQRVAETVATYFADSM